MSGEKQGPRTATDEPGRRLSDEAIDWLVRLGSGRATSKDRLAFLCWRRRSVAHEAAAVEAETLLSALGETRQANRLRRLGEPLSAEAAHRRRIGRRVLCAGAAAAASVAVAAVALPSLGPLSALYADHATGVGGRKRIALADGSVAILNTATAVSVEYSAKERRVVLNDGEALFEVAKDANRPFIVVAGGVEVRAVGTAFVVRLKDACEHVTVSEGAVEVKIGSRPPIRVEAGRQLGVGVGDRITLRAVDVNAATAWQRGKLIFNRRPLDSVVAELQRYRAGRIVVLGDRLKALEVTGLFDLDDTDRILRTIEETTKARIVNMPLLTVIR
jgi:transmembrane sensor